jgi:hypothetical protein
MAFTATTIGDGKFDRNKAKEMTIDCGGKRIAEASIWVTTGGNVGQSSLIFTVGTTTLSKTKDTQVSLKLRYSAEISKGMTFLKITPVSTSPK